MTIEEIRAVAIQVATNLPNATEYNLISNANYIANYIEKGV